MSFSLENFKTVEGMKSEAVVNRCAQENGILVQITGHPEIGTVPSTHNFKSIRRKAIDPLKNYNFM